LSRGAILGALSPRGDRGEEGGGAGRIGGAIRGELAEQFGRPEAGFVECLGLDSFVFGMSTGVKKMVPDVEDVTTSIDNSWMSVSGTPGIGMQYESQTLSGVPVLLNRENSKTLEVSPEYTNGGVWKFATLAAALTQAATMGTSSSNPVLIILHAGVHTISASANVPTYVHIQGKGIQCTVLSYTASGATLKMADGSMISHLWLAGNVTASIGVQFQFVTGMTGYIYRCYFTGFTSAALQNAANSGILKLRQSRFTNSSGTPKMVDIANASQVTEIMDCVFESTSTGVSCISGNMYLGNNRFKSITTKAVSLSNAAVTCVISGGVFEDCVIGLSMTNSVAHDVKISGCVFTNASDTSTNAPIVGTNSLYNVQMTGCVASIRNTTTALPASGNRAQMNLAYMQKSQNFGRGLHVSNGLTLGWKSDRVQLWTCNGGLDQTNMVVATYNTSDVLQSTDTAVMANSGGTATPIPNLPLATLGYTIIGEDEMFFGLQYLVNVAGDVSTADFQLQYLATGGVWTTFDWCVDCNSLFHENALGYDVTNRQGDIYPADSTGNRVSQRNILFDVALQRSTLSPAWTSQSFGSSGTKYWIRIRKLDATWAVRSTMSQLNTLNDTTSHQRRVQKHGRCRGWKNVPFSIANLSNSGMGAPSVADVWCGSKIHANAIQLDSSCVVSGYFYFPTDMDMSSPLEIVLAYMSTSSAATQSDFSLNMKASVLPTGFQLKVGTTGSDPTYLQSQTIAVTPNQTNGQILAQKHVWFSFPNGNCRSAYNNDTDLCALFIESGTIRADSLILVAVEIRYISNYDGNGVS